MEKVWFIDINGKAEGPFDIDELKKDLRITPDTYVWKDGFDRWIQIRLVPELKEIFEDHKNTKTDEDDEESDENLKKDEISPEDEIVLGYREDFPSFFLWLFIVFCLMLYIFYRLQNID